MSRHVDFYPKRFSLCKRLEGVELDNDLERFRLLRVGKTLAEVNVHVHFAQSESDEVH